MIPHRSPTVDPTKILTRQELRLVLADLKRQSQRSKQGHVNLILFRLAACCGLRVSEIANLHLVDVRTDGPRPHLRIRRAAAKGHKARVVPLWWDAGTLADIAAWKLIRGKQNAGADALFLVSPRPGRSAIIFSRHTLRRRFRTACKVLGLARLNTLTIHHGRHTFISHALAGNRTLAEVRDAAGHANVSLPSADLHVAVDDEGIGNLFDVS
ncbi:MAG TPA: site-specific integrase [Planctomycetaceae bacterium]|nr:site-specific integrase [Planctomycetaceae bacterium]